MQSVTSMLRLVLGFLFVAVMSCLTMLIALVLLPSRVLRIKLCNVYGKIVGRSIVAIAGVTPEIEHRERLDGSMPAIYVTNHTSTLDAFLGVWMCPMGGCGVFKKEVVRVPFFGQLAWLSGHLLLDRFNRGRALESLRETADLVKKHRLGIWILPEGTRSKDGRLLPFKKGFVHLAIATGFKVVPVVVHGAHRNWELGTFRFVPMKLKIEVLPAIDTSSWTEDTATDHAEAVRRLFIEHLPADQQPAPAPVPIAA
jgi:1-acyl-sn-glycerol-3-phosphate acyltransferase